MHLAAIDALLHLPFPSHFSQFVWLAVSGTQGAGGDGLGGGGDGLGGGGGEGEGGLGEGGGGGEGEGGSGEGGGGGDGSGGLGVSGGGGEGEIAGALQPLLALSASGQVTAVLLRILTFPG